LSLTVDGVKPTVVVDSALAVVLGVLAAWGSWEAAADRGTRLGVVAFALVAVAAAALAVRRVAPLAALGLSLAATLAYLAWGNPYSSILQLTAVAAYSVGAWCRERVALAAVAVAVAAYVPVAWRDGTPWPSFGVGPLAAVWLLLPAAAGAGVRAYRRATARALDAERRSHAFQERLRIARDVHDVVGHSLAVINMQAGVALHVLDRRPERAAEALRAVRQTSAQAMQELRATLAEFSDRGPAPGLARIGQLVADLGAAVAADLDVTGEPPARLPAAVDLAGYRIVQEALTNVVRHAAARRVTVTVAYAPDRVTVTVADDGLGTAAPPRAGRGLVGMRERAEALGGTFAAAPRPAGGFEVRAVLPLSEVEDK